MDYDTIEQEICAWAKERDDVQALVVIGSRARTSYPADAWSDLDLILFVTNPEAFSKDAAWLSQFGEIWLQTSKMTGIGDPEWLVLYAEGLKVDFLLAPVTGSLVEMLYGPKYLFVTRRGVRVLLNKQGEENLEIPPDWRYEEWRRPTEADFTAVLNQFWLSAFRAATMLRRSELWRAKMIIDSDLRQMLLDLLEWQAKAVNGDDYEIWHDGRFLQEWADPQATKALPEIFAQFDKTGSSHALLQMIDLGDKLGKETARHWRYHYPAATAMRIREWIVVALMN
jgi:aminoglycoside 6-adenylyltransferase